MRVEILDMFYTETSSMWETFVGKQMQMRRSRESIKILKKECDIYADEMIMVRIGLWPKKFVRKQLQR